MSKKRGLSFDEKKERLIDLFYETKDVYLLKDLEKTAPKAKGIVSQSVKDVLQALVDDNLVESDKIGSSIYYWSFPSRAANDRTQKIEEIEKRIEEMKRKEKVLEEEIAKHQSPDTDAEEREIALKQYKILENERNELKVKVLKLSDCDPQVFEQMKKDVTNAKGGINRWTDNVLSIKSWCKSKFSLEESRLDKQFEIPEDFDYIG